MQTGAMRVRILWTRTGLCLFEALEQLFCTIHPCAQDLLRAASREMELITLLCKTWSDRNHSAR